MKLVVYLIRHYFVRPITVTHSVKSQVLLLQEAAHPEATGSLSP